MSADGTIKIAIEGDDTPLKEALEGLGDVAKKGMDVVVKSIAAVSTALFGLGTASVKVGSDFEQSMSTLAGITGMTADEIKRMEDGIRKIAALPGAPSLLEIANNAKMVAEAGGDVNLALEQMTHGTNLAISTQTNMATTLDFVGSTMKTFGLEAEDTQAAVDSVASVTTRANLELPQLAESYKNVGGEAANAGLSIDDTNAFLINFANAGTKGGAAGTELAGVLRNLSTPTKAAADELDRLNIALYEGGKRRDTLVVMEELEQVLKGLDDEARNSAESIIFDTVSLKGWNIIAKEGIGEIKGLSEELSNSVNAFGGMGQAAGMVAKQTDNLKGDISGVKSELADLGVSIFEQLNKPLREAAQTAKESISNISNSFKSAGFEGMINQLGAETSKWIDIVAQQAPKMIEMSADLIHSFIIGVKNNTPALTETAVSIGTTIIDGSVTIIPDMASLGVKLTGSLISGMFNAIPDLIGSFGKLISKGNALTVVLGTVTAGFVAFKATVAVQQWLTPLILSLKASSVAITEYTAVTALAALGNEAAAGASALLVGTLKVQDIAVGALTGKIGALTAVQMLAEKAQLALNAAWIANPVGVVVVGVAALAAALIGVNALVNKQTEEEKALVKETEALVEANNKLNESIKLSKKEFEDKTNSIEDEAIAAQRLTDEIYALAAQEEKSAVEKEKLKFLVDTLNESMDGLNLQYDEENDKLSKSYKTILDSIEARKELAKTTAYQEELIRLYKEQIEMERELENVRAKIEEHDLYGKTIAQLMVISKGNKELVDEYNALLEYERDRADNMEELGMRIESLAEKTSGYSETIDNTTDALNTNTTATDENANSTQKATTNYEKLLESISSVAKESSKLQSAYQTLQKSEELSAETLLDLISKYPKIASYIATTNDLTLDKGEILKEVLNIQKETLREELTNEQTRLKELITNAKTSIEITETEFKEKAKIMQAYYESMGFVSSSNFADLYDSAEVEAQKAALAELEKQLADVEARTSALNNLELTYTETKKKSKESTEKLTEATAEYISEIENLIKDTENKIQQEIEGTTATQLTEKKKQLEEEQKSSDQKLKINKIALAKMNADSATIAEEWAKFEREYNELVLSYQNEYLKKSLEDKEKVAKEAYTNEKNRIETLKYFNEISLSEQLAAWENFYKTLEEGSEQSLAVEKEIYSLRKQLEEDLKKDIVEALKERNSEASEIEQYHLDKQLEAVKTVTDEKIKEYQREYDEKIKLIDEASQAEIDALQSQLDTLTEQDTTDKSYENVKKLIELNQAIAKAAMGDGDLAWSYVNKIDTKKRKELKINK